MHATKPGHQLEPPSKIHTCDPQEAIDRCLNCTAKRCRGTCDDLEEIKYNPRGYDYETRRKYPEIDAKVEPMLKVGYSDYPICQAVGITMAELKRSKKRIRYRWRKEGKK